MCDKLETKKDPIETDADDISETMARVEAWCIRRTSRGVCNALRAVGAKPEPGTCRSCGARVIWALTANDKRAIIDPGTGESHFATCPKSEQHRS